MSTTVSGMQLRRISGPDIEPVSLALARKQCKLDADLTAEDELLSLYIKAAREAFEDYTKTTVCESTWRLTAREFPASCDSDGRIYLPHGPLIQVTSVSYLDNDGARVSVDEWVQSDGDIPGWLEAPHGTFWPSAPCRTGSVVVEYRAGYPGAGSPEDDSGVPAGIKQAILFMVGFWFENREVVNIGNMTTALPYGWEFALQPYKVYP